MSKHSTHVENTYRLIFKSVIHFPSFSHLLFRIVFVNRQTRPYFRTARESHFNWQTCSCTAERKRRECTPSKFNGNTFELKLKRFPGHQEDYFQNLNTKLFGITTKGVLRFEGSIQAARIVLSSCSSFLASRRLRFAIASSCLYLFGT